MCLLTIDSILSMVFTACNGGDVDPSGAATLPTGCFRSATLAGSISK